MPGTTRAQAPARTKGLQLTLRPRTPWGWSVGRAQAAALSIAGGWGADGIEHVVGWPGWAQERIWSSPRSWSRSVPEDDKGGPASLPASPVPPPESRARQGAPQRSAAAGPSGPPPRRGRSPPRHGHEGSPRAPAPRPPHTPHPSPRCPRPETIRCGPVPTRLGRTTLTDLCPEPTAKGSPEGTCRGGKQR